jgi:hypothetical protein
MLLRALLIFLLAGGCSAQTVPLFSEVDGILQELSRMTGWEVKRKVPSEVLPKGEFAKILEQGVKDAERDKDVHATELTLKMFGLAPWNFNLARESAALMGEQAAAYYDGKKKRLYFVKDPAANDTPLYEQRLELAHELAHALADQQFPIEKYMRAAKDDDASTARQAVVEGQASWLSWAYLNLRTRGRAEVPASVMNQLADAAGQTGAEFPVLSQTPLYMRESLLFPYTEGMKFQDAIFRREGKASFDKVFRDPPLSTQDILHPDAYERGVVPTHPQLLRLETVVGKEAGHFNRLIDGDVGEFDFSALLRQYISDRAGSQAASGWRGGFYELYGHKKEKYPLLVFASEWESAAAAQRFFELYQQVLRAKWQHMEVQTASPTELRGTGDTGDFLLRLDGAFVHGMEGIHGSPDYAPQTRGLVR